MYIYRERGGKREREREQLYMPFYVFLSISKYNKLLKVF